MSSHRSSPSRRVIEFDLDLFRLSALLLAIAIIVLVIYWMGRASVVDQSDRGATQMQTSEAARSSGPVEDISESGSIFDTVDENRPRESARQATDELSRQGRIAIPIQRSRTLGEINRLAEQLESVDVPSIVSRASDGTYELSAGPFADRARAQRAATTLTRELGREIRVPEASRE